MPGRPEDVLKVPSGLRSIVGGISGAGKVHRPVSRPSTVRKEAGSSARQLVKKNRKSVIVVVRVMSCQ